MTSHGENATESDALICAHIMEGQRLLDQGEAEAAKDQFEAATDIMYRSYQDYIYRLCLSLLHDAAQAEELSHETLSAAYFAMPKFRHEASVKTWLSGICHKRMKQTWRNQGRRTQLFQAQQKQIREETHMTASEDAVRALVDTLREYDIDQLSRRDQTLFVKRFIEGYSLAELTTRWTSEAAVRKRLVTIVQRLQRTYKDGG